MATQYDPIAKDGSLNTTEVTPRNIADVLAEGLKGIEDALPTYTEGDGIDISNNEISVDTTFTEASTRANIASGETFATILGKIKKFFTDLKTVAFTGAYSDLSGTENVAYKNVNNRFTENQLLNRADGTTSTVGTSQFTLGNDIAAGTDQNSRGELNLWGNGSAFAKLRASDLTANRIHELPDKTGTVALTSDLTWKYLSTTTIADTTAGTVTIPSDVKELLVSVGSNNNGQVFGGKNFVMQNTLPQYDIIVTGELINGSGTTVSTKGVYLSYNGATSLSYRALDIVSGRTLAMRIYYR